MDESALFFPGMNTQLYRAAVEGNVSELNKLIKVKLNFFQEFTAVGNSVLHIAVSHGNHRFIKRLLEEVNKESVAGREFLRAKNSDGNNALHLAAFYGHHDLVEKFLALMKGDEWADNFLSSGNNEGNTALHEAAKGGNSMVVEILLKYDRDYKLKYGRNDNLASVSNREGETALFIASQSGHTQIVEILLDLMDSNSSMKRHDGQTPLHCAVFYGHRGVVKKLVQYSPDLAKQTDRCGRTAMHMLALSSPAPALMGYAWTSIENCQIARLLLEEDNSLCYKQDDKKQTPLHMAVERADYWLVKILLKYGRDCIEVVDNKGRKPLHVAVLNAARASRAINAIVLYGLKNMWLSLMSRESVNHRDNTGRTALHIAVENTEEDAVLYESIIKLLQLNGALLTPEIADSRDFVKLLPGGWVSFKAENVSINAVLIATVSFAAAFTLPGGLTQAGEKPKAVFINALLFKLFLICDTLSFCTSIASAIVVQFSDVDGQQDQSQVRLGINLLWLALISLVVAFGAAVHMVIAPSPWLASTVWAMVSLVPITIRVVRSHSKRFIFSPQRHTIWYTLHFPSGFIFKIFLIIWDTLNAFLFTGLFYNVAHWIKNLLKRRR